MSAKHSAPTLRGYGAVYRTVGDLRAFLSALEEHDKRIRTQRRSVQTRTDLIDLSKASSTSLQEDERVSQQRGEDTPADSPTVQRPHIPHSLTHELRFTSSAVRCDYLVNDKLFATLLARFGEKPVILYHDDKLILELSDLDGYSRNSSVEVKDNNSVGRSRWGSVRRIEITARSRGGDRAVRIDAEILQDLRFHSSVLQSWWRLVVPYAADEVENLSLPLRITVSCAPGVFPDIGLKLTSLKQASFSKADFEIPQTYRQADGSRVDQKARGLKRAPRDDLTKMRKKLGKNREAPQRSTSRIFAVLPDEDVKVILSDTLVNRTFDAINRATSYLGEFFGERFIFITDDWFRQIEANAPEPQGNCNGLQPQDAHSRSILPHTMLRLALLELAYELDSLHLPDHNNDLDQAVGALQDGIKIFRWWVFLTHIDRKRLRSALLSFAQLDIPSCLEDPLRNLDCLRPLWTRYESMNGENLTDLGQFKELGRIWIGQRPHQVDVAPDLPSRRQRDGAEVFWSSARRHIAIDGIADLVDAELSNFEHHINFGRRPLLSQLQFMDSDMQARLGNIFPSFAQWDEVRFGFLTGITVHQLMTSCDVDVSPTVNGWTVLLGLFCPPCLAALFQSGSASVEALDVELPLFLYVAQDNLAFNPPSVRCIVGDPHFGDLNVATAFPPDWLATLASGGLQAVLGAVISIVGSALGEEVLEGQLDSMREKISDQVNNALQVIPLLNAGEIVKFDHATNRQAAPENTEVPEVFREAYQGRFTSPERFQLETTAWLGSRYGRSGPITFPTGGLPLQTEMAIVVSRSYLTAGIWPILQRDWYGPVMSKNTDGSISEVDWWKEAPDQTGMPSRPAKANQGGPPRVSLLPGAQASFWGYSALMFIHALGYRIRDLQNDPPDSPILDLFFKARILARATKFVTLTYDVCEDVTRVLGKILDPHGPGNPLPGPRPGPGPDPAPFGDQDPASVMVGGSFHRHPNPEAVDLDGEPIPGMLDDVRYAFIFGPRDYRPHPDDPGPTPVPAVSECRTITTWQGAEQETWLDCDSEFSFPVRLGIAETARFEGLTEGGFKFLPIIDFRADASELTVANLPFNIQATGPLDTLNLPRNQEWLKGLMADGVVRFINLYGLSNLGDLQAEYGLDSPLDLCFEPGAFKPSLFFRLASLTTFPASSADKNLAIKINVDENILDRI